MSDLPPEYLHAPKETLNGIVVESKIEDAGDSEAHASSPSNGVQDAAISTKKVTTVAELLAIEGNKKCFDCNTEVCCKYVVRIVANFRQAVLWVNVSYCVFICAPCATIQYVVTSTLKISC